MPKESTGLPDLLGSLLRTAEASYSDRAHRVWEVWESAAGPDVAKRAGPISLRRGSLLVGVTTAPWMQQLSFLREHLRDSINRQLGEDLVREIRFRMAESQSLAPPSRSSEPPPWLGQALDPANLAGIEKEVSGIADAELREAVRRARTRFSQMREFQAARGAGPLPQSNGHGPRGEPEEV